MALDRLIMKGSSRSVMAGTNALLLELDTKRYDLMRNAERHCNLEASWERFQRDIDSVDNARESGIGDASALEEKLRKLRSDLRFGGGYDPSSISPRPPSAPSATRETIDTKLDRPDNQKTPRVEPHPEVESTKPTDTDDNDDEDISLPSSSSVGDVDEVEKTESTVKAWVQNIHPDHALKLRQHQFRVAALEEDIINAHKAQQSLSERRAFLGLQLVHAQERILELNSEADRIALYNGRDIISNVLHGSDQNFAVNELKRDLQEELRTVKGNIATWKAEIISGDDQEEKLDKTLIAKKQRLIERKGALRAFQSQLQSADRIRKRLQDAVCGYRQTNNGESAIQDCVRQWRTFVKKKRAVGVALDAVSRGLARKICTEALYRWREEIRTTMSGISEENLSKNDSPELSGAGDALLVKAQKEWYRNARDLVAIMSSVASASTSSNSDSSGHATVPDILTDEDHTLFLKADFYFDAEQLQASLRCYESLLENLSRASDTIYAAAASRKDMADLYCFLYIRVALIHLNLKENSNDVALMYADRGLTIAQEFGFNEHIAQALLCIGQCFYAKEEQAAAVLYFDRALIVSSSGSSGIESGTQSTSTGRPTSAKAASTSAVAAHRGLQKCYTDLGMDEKAEESKSLADQVTRSREMRLAAANETIDDLKSRLVNVTAETADVVSLQRVTPHYIKLKLEKRRSQNQIEATKQEVEATERAAKDSNTLLRAINKQLESAKAPDAPAKMISSLVHENAQEFDTPELIYRLKVRQEEVVCDIQAAEKHQRCLRTNIKNSEDDLEGIRNDLLVENGPLMQRILDKRIIRCMALSSSNAAGNDVMGGATGGVEYCVLSEGKDIYVHHLRSGKLIFVFRGDEEGKHIGEVVGHTSFITCLYSYGTFIYSGSMDKTIMCWNADDGQRVFVARGHEATVTCISVDDTKMITGSADKTLGVWDRETGQLLRRLDGHPRGILSVHCGPSWCVSGDSDGTVLVWDDKFQFRQNLRLPRARITVVRYGELEVITGDSNGCIAIWWIKTGAILKQCKAHEGSVADLQFDATRVISCGFDGTVQVVDILTGDVLQTLRGHDGPVLAVSFDSRSILSASRDGTLRRWVWGDMSSRFEDKIHTFAAGDTLPAISQRYEIELDDLITWNGIRDAKLVYPGAKLIVKKGDPTSRTKAEIRAERNLQREQMREKRMMRLCLQSDAGKIGEKGNGDEAEDVAKILEHMLKLGLRDDPSTLANRYIGKKERNATMGKTLAMDSDSKRKKPNGLGAGGMGTLSSRLRRT